MSEQCIKVFVRVRPLTQKQIAKNNTQILQIDQQEKQIILFNQNERKNNKTFSFDDVFHSKTPQKTVYELAASHLTKEVLQGYNGTVFAYGQTGSGKTYSMMGDLRNQQQIGLIPRCFSSIIETAKQDKSKDFLIMCSYIQLYNEQFRDLLHINDKTKLELRQSPEKGIFIKDLKRISITSYAEMMKYLKVGSQNRTTGQTLMNSQSSRSHSIFTLYVQSLEKTSGKQSVQKLVGSKFNLVDLAGSQRQSKTGSIGQRFVEATKINLSLAALGKVISSLVQGKGSFIPYRDSKLTRILQDSLGGNAKTVMIATISASGYNYQQTLSTLKYASRAKYITNVPIINLDPKDALLKQYEIQIRRLRMALGDIQRNDQPDLDSLIQENKRIAKEAELQKKQLISKIKKLQEQFIKTPYAQPYYELPQKYKQESIIREQKLNYMQKNYKSLEEEVQQMKTLLSELRKKYKAASKEIFQMENQHEKEKQYIKQQFDEVQKENIMLRSILNILFSEKQLKNIVGLGRWEGENKFKLPMFYFKDRQTLAFPCQQTQNQDIEQTKNLRQKSHEKKINTLTSFGARINGGSSSKSGSIAKKY